MHSTVVHILCVMLVAVSNPKFGTAGSNETLVVATHSSDTNVNATVSKVIDAILANGPNGDSAIPIPDHHHDKAQRIVARKGVINDERVGLIKGLAVPGPNDSSFTRHIVASNEKPPNVTSASVPVMVGGNANGAQNGTSSSFSTSRNSEATKTTSSHSSQSSNFQLPLAMVNNTANTTTSSSSSSSSFSISAVTAAASTPKPTQSKPPAAGGTTATQRPSTSESTITTSINSTWTTASTNTRTTTTTAGTVTPIRSSSSTTIKPLKKPTITYSVDDEPKLLQAARSGYTASYADPMDSSGRLRVDEPRAQLSKEYVPSQLGGFSDSTTSHREYVVPIVTLIFAIPLLLGLFLLSYRRAKEFWLTRHYRRMDFLIDGMYNY